MQTTPVASVPKQPLIAPMWDCMIDMDIGGVKERLATHPA
jgi:hypothetical protein